MRHYIFTARGVLVSVTLDEVNARLSCALRDGWYHVTDEYVDRGGCNAREKEQIKDWRENNS